MHCKPNSNIVVDNKYGPYDNYMVHIFIKVSNRI